MTLKDFLYLDRTLVRTFLAQVDGGEIDELTERERSAGRGGTAARIGTGGTGIGADRSKEHSLETEATLRQSGPSEFDRLMAYLEENDLTTLEALDTIDGANAVKRKEFLEVDARIRVSGMHELGNLLGSVSKLAPMLSQFGVPTESTQLEQIETLASLAGGEDKVSVIATVLGKIGFVIGLELDPAFSKTDKWDVDATVLMKVQRVLKVGETQILGDPLGGIVRLAPAEQVSQLMDTLKSPDLAKLGINGESQVSYPGAVATPIAIYR
ncbi:MAG: DUF6414 family protein [Microbacteriaceae bacterium]